LTEEVRQLGYSADTPLAALKMGAMFKKAEKRGAKFALILGEDELNKGVAQLKNLKTKEQSEISLKDLGEELDAKAFDKPIRMKTTMVVGRRARQGAAATERRKAIRKRSGLRPHEGQAVPAAMQISETRRKRRARNKTWKEQTYNGELRSKTSARKSPLVGWVSTKRNLGAIEFIDLRDNTGIVQLTIPEREQSPGCPERIRDSGQRHRPKERRAEPEASDGDVEVLSQLA
jgi:hypothetical protein